MVTLAQTRNEVQNGKITIDRVIIAIDLTYKELGGIGGRNYVFY